MPILFVSTAPGVPLFVAFNLGDWLGPAVVAFFFFILPILRAIKESKEKQREIAAKRGGTVMPPSAPPDSERELARKKWEALLRGEEVDTMPWEPPAVTQTAEPQPAASLPAPPYVQPSTVHERVSDVGHGVGRERPLSAPLSSFESIPTEEEQEATFDEERFARMENEQRLREEMQRRSEFLRPEREGVSVRAGVATSIAPGAAAATIAPSADIARRRDVFGAGSDAGLGTRSALRRAILASEIFGPPVALRERGGPNAPVGARN